MEGAPFPRLLQAFHKNNCLVFGGLWAVVFVLYFPTAHAGWVSDTMEWLQKIRYERFWDYVNLKQSRGDLYQFTQIATYIFYKLFGTHRWPWHLLFVTMHAGNAALVYVICNKLLAHSGTKNGFVIAAGAAVLFCICPHVSEVVVWKASYHYLQALLMALYILYWAQRFLTIPTAKYAWYAGILFFFSSFSHEFFYLTPWFVCTLIIYYRVALDYDKVVCKKAFLYFFIPMLVIFSLHMVLVRALSGAYSGELEAEIRQPFIYYLSKPPLYLFHIMLLGRFLSHDIRSTVYHFFSGAAGVALFYGLLVIAGIYILLRFKKIAEQGKAMILVFIWMLLCMALVAPVSFPDSFLVDFDRYAYFMQPFIYVLLMFLIVNIRVQKMAIALFTIYAIINIYCTTMVNTYWRQSAHIVDNLVHSVPPVDNKMVLLLNVPEYMNGIRMIGPFLHFSFRQVYNLNNSQPIDNQVYDVVSYNMTDPADGAHITVINDSVLHVTLNQWGTWWWANMRGAFSYDNPDYKFDLKDPGHWYELTLRHPASQYLLLYNVGDQWKIADMNRKNEDQN